MVEGCFHKVFALNENHSKRSVYKSKIIAYYHFIKGLLFEKTSMWINIYQTLSFHKSSYIDHSAKKTYKLFQSMTSKIPIKKII
jgi:hypothetical protein